MNDEDFLIAAGEGLQLLKDVSPSEYWRSNLPSEVDESVADVCDLYVQTTSDQRGVLASDLNQTAYFNLGAFSVRMVMVSVRQNSKTLLLKGLVALIIKMKWPKTDTREVLMDLAVLYHSAARLGNPVALFHVATQYADTEKTRDLLLGYLRRSSENKRLEVMGWKEAEGPSGLVYQFEGQPIPEGFL